MTHIAHRVFNLIIIRVIAKVIKFTLRHFMFYRVSEHPPKLHARFMSEVILSYNLFTSIGIYKFAIRSTFGSALNDSANCLTYIRSM